MKPTVNKAGTYESTEQAWKQSSWAAQDWEAGASGLPLTCWRRAQTQPGQTAPRTLRLPFENPSAVTLTGNEMSPGNKCLCATLVGQNGHVPNRVPWPQLCKHNHQSHHSSDWNETPHWAKALSYFTSGNKAKIQMIQQSVEVQEKRSKLEEQRVREFTARCPHTPTESFQSWGTDAARIYQMHRRTSQTNAGLMGLLCHLEAQHNCFKAALPRPKPRPESSLHNCCNSHTNYQYHSALQHFGKLSLSQEQKSREGAQERLTVL